jgi:hypothetical protein
MRVTVWPLQKAESYFATHPAAKVQAVIKLVVVYSVRGKGFEIAIVSACIGINQKHI